MILRKTSGVPARVVIEELRQRDLLTMVERVCSTHHVTAEQVCGPHRFSREAARARHEIWFILFSVHRFGYSGIGKLFRRDHTGVMYALRKLAA